MNPDPFFAELPQVLKEVPPLPGEEALYAQIRSVLDAAEKDPKLAAALKDVAKSTETQVIKPLFQFQNNGLPQPYNWTTIRNGAQWGTDYYSRTAAAKANIFVNKPNETIYFYLDSDASGARLNGGKTYSVTFAKGTLPPVKGFWSLTLYNEHHFFHANPLKRFSLGTKNKTLKYNDDGSLTLYAGGKPPAGDKQANWLPAPSGAFSLYLRCYWPEAPITEGKWSPPPVGLAK